MKQSVIPEELVDPDSKLNPGSDEAVKNGCKCPVWDNNHGRGIVIRGEQRAFWIMPDCPHHGTKK